MKISVTKDNGSGVWNVATDLFHDDNPVKLGLDAALFDQDKLAIAQPKDNGPLLSGTIFQLIRGQGSGNNSCILLIDKSVTSFPSPSDPASPHYRGSLLTDFDHFIGQINANEGNFIRHGAGDLLRRVIAGVLPASFAESLYFHYGFSRRDVGGTVGKQFYVNLVAGMRLRLDIQFSQLVLPGATSFGPLVNGFVASGQALYNIVDVSNNGTPQLGFDAFLATNSLTQVAASQGGAGGVVDLLGARHRYFRICYPSQLMSSDSAGFQGARSNVILLGADDIATLESSTASYFTSGSVTMANAAAVFFRGRTIAVPEIGCLLNGELTYVPVGTTVRQLFSRFALIPRLAGFSPPNFPYRRVAPSSRLVQHSLFGGFSGAFPDTYTNVSFQSATVVDGSQDAYDLPVLAGDSYRLD